MLRTSVLVGTRPELIKLYPVIEALRRDPDNFDTRVTATGQHREALQGLLPDNLFRFNQWLNPVPEKGRLDALLGQLICEIGKRLSSESPDLVVVQGDTASSLAGALAASQLHIPVAHVEAGLRTGNPDAPFPEEINRKLIAQVTSLHFAPTAQSRNNLLREGIDAAKIAVTGNTAIDMMKIARRLPAPLRLPASAYLRQSNRPYAVVTCHRRESWQQSLREICMAIQDISLAVRDMNIIFVLPNNPALHGPIKTILGNCPRVRLTAPLDYRAFIDLLSSAALIISDSGGIQEEAPSLNIPTIVIRNETDRPEISLIPFIRLAGTQRAAIVAAGIELLAEAKKQNGNAILRNPFGDGEAAGRIVTALKRWQAGCHPLLEPAHEFACS